MKEWMTESGRVESNVPAFLMGSETLCTRILNDMLPATLQPPLPRLDLPKADFSENEESQIADEPALETPDANTQNAPHTPCAPGSRKSTRKNFGKPATSFSDFYM